MATEYGDLHSLILQNQDARQFYNELPKHVRDEISSYSDNITSYEGLIACVENLVRG